MTIDSILLALAYILIFPGFAFLAAYGLFLQWLDRKLPCMSRIFLAATVKS